MMVRGLARGLPVSKDGTNGTQNSVASRSTEEGQVDRETGTIVCLGA